MASDRRRRQTRSVGMGAEIAQPAATYLTVGCRCLCRSEPQKVSTAIRLKRQRRLQCGRCGIISRRVAERRRSQRRNLVGIPQPEAVREADALAGGARSPVSPERSEPRKRNRRALRGGRDYSGPSRAQESAESLEVRASQDRGAVAPRPPEMEVIFCCFSARDAAAYEQLLS